MNPKLNQYVMVAEAAEALGVPQGTVGSWQDSDAQKAANRYRLFKRAELEKILRVVSMPSPKRKSK